jgi:hypothetical protein
MQFQNGNAEIEFGCTLSDVVLAAPTLPHRTRRGWGTLNSIGRSFAQLKEGLDRAVAKLKETTDPTCRRKLLLDLRVLLAEADRFLVSETSD